MTGKAAAQLAAGYFLVLLAFVSGKLQDPDLNGNVVDLLALVGNQHGLRFGIGTAI